MISKEDILDIFNRYIPVLFWMGLIFFLSAQEQLPSIPGLDEISWSDKIKHGLAYAVLAFLLFRAIKVVNIYKKQALIVFVVMLFGLSDEFHQLFVPGRSFDLFDLAADTMGALIFCISVSYYKGGYYLGRQRKKT